MKESLLKMSSAWRKVENENGFAFYVNELTSAKQWDHPKFAEIKQRIDDLEEVPLTIISGVFERHRLGTNESSLCLESCDLEAVLTDIYFAANKQNHTNTDIDFATELMLNFLYNVYDKDREGKIQVFSTKLLLAILSNCNISDLYHFIFNLCADHNNCVTRMRLQMVLLKLSDITNFMHEDVSYGQHLVNSSIEDCFRNSPGLVGINESTYMSWVESGPQILSWIPTVFRLKSAESVVHSVRCSVCRTTPLMGLRYRCIKCTRYTQCQHCFLTGRVSHSHKLSHSMKEYCSEGSTSEFAHAVIKKLCGLLRCSVQNSFATSTTETRPLNEEKDWLLTSTCTSETANNIQPLSSPHSQLQVVIRQLEMQNSELQHMLLIGSRNDKEMKHYLEKHRMHIATQIHKLKMLKDYLRVSQPTLVYNSLPDNLQSTPLVSNNGKHTRIGLDMLSPIAPIPECSFSAEDLQSTEQPNFITNGGCSVKESTQGSSLSSYSLKDISTWIGGRPSTSVENGTHMTFTNRKSPARMMHNDLDDALAKLQQILATNFILDESLGTVDNSQLKSAVNEVEGMLTSLIDSVENSRASSAQSIRRSPKDSSVVMGSCKYV